MAGTGHAGPICSSEHEAIDDGTSCRQRSSPPGTVGTRQGTLADLETALALFEAEAAGFGLRFIQDGAVRQDYARNVKQAAQAIREEVKAGRMRIRDGVVAATDLRNEMMAVARLRSSDLGRAGATALKGQGLTLAGLETLYAQRMFGKPFEALAQAERHQVWLAIVEASGRTRPAVTIGAARWARLGRGLILLSVACAVFNIVTAEDKGRQAVKEGVTAGAGVLGGMAGGAIAGAACGPGAPVCIVVGIFVGGVLAAAGADLTFDALW